MDYGKHFVTTLVCFVKGKGLLSGGLLSGGLSSGGSLCPTPDFHDLGGKNRKSVDSGLRYRENSRTFLT